MEDLNEIFLSAVTASYFVSTSEVPHKQISFFLRDSQLMKSLTELNEC